MKIKTSTKNEDYNNQEINDKGLEQLSDRIVLFLDCYWDKDNKLYVRYWTYVGTTNGFKGQSWSPQTTSVLYGFAISREDKKNIDDLIKQGVDSAKVLNKYRFGLWKEVSDQSMLLAWRNHNTGNEYFRAVNYLVELNTANYFAIKAELKSLSEDEVEDKKHLETNDILKDYFPKQLYLRKDEPSTIREIERNNLKRIKEDFETWFYSHGINTTNIKVMDKKIYTGKKKKQSEHDKVIKCYKKLAKKRDNRNKTKEEILNLVAAELNKSFESTKRAYYFIPKKLQK
ncbi:MAG: hypothetical protein PHP42_09535 [Bacteroidota bacterium]|nr:hypothetical protein [Bacteroidota bacterium]